MFGKLMKDILTGIDNHTFDNGRVIALFSFATYNTMALASFYVMHPWSATDYATGAAAMAVGFGFNLRLKRKTEPGND